MPAIKFKYYIHLWALGCIILAFDSCQNSNIKYANTTSLPVRSDNHCDYRIWEHVYNHSRLKILDTCKVVSGVIIESNADDDGDEHMLLKLDGAQDSLLTFANHQRKQGAMVIEAICVNNIYKKKVGNACEGYINNIELPKINDHVIVTGSYVIDTHNGWAEIHPISKIEKVK